MASNSHSAAAYSKATQGYLDLLAKHAAQDTSKLPVIAKARIGGVKRSISPIKKSVVKTTPILLGTSTTASSILGMPVKPYKAPSWAFTGPSAEFIYAAGDVATLPRMVWGLVDGINHTSMQPGVKALGFTTCLVAISGVATVSRGHEYLKTAEKVNDVAGKTIGKVLITRGVFESAGGFSFIPIRTMNWLGTANTSPAAASALGVISKIGYGIMGFMYALLMVPSCLTVHYARQFKAMLDKKLKEGIIPTLEFLKESLHLSKEEVTTTIDTVLNANRDKDSLYDVETKKLVFGAINKREMALIDQAIEKKYPERLQREHKWRLSDKKKLVQHISQALIKQKAVKDRELRRSIGDEIVTELQKEFGRDESEMKYDVSGFIERYANPLDPVAVFAKDSNFSEEPLPIATDDNLAGAGKGSGLSSSAAISSAISSAITPSGGAGSALPSVDASKTSKKDGPTALNGNKKSKSHIEMPSRKKSLLAAIRQPESSLAITKEKEKALLDAAALIKKVKSSFSSNMKVHGAVIAACVVGVIGLGLAMLLLFGVGGNAMNIAVYADFSLTTLMMTGIDFTFLAKAYKSGAPIKKEKAVLVLISLLLVAITVATLVSGPSPLLKGVMWGITGTWGAITAYALFKWVLKNREEKRQMERIQAVMKKATSGMPAIPIGGI